MTGSDRPPHRPVGAHGRAPGPDRGMAPPAPGPDRGLAPPAAGPDHGVARTAGARPCAPTARRPRARAGMPVPRVVAILLLCLPVFGQDLEIDPYLPLVLQGQWHPIVWEALIPVRTPDPASYLANLPHPLPVKPALPLPVVVPLPLAHVPPPRTGKDARATVPGAVTVVVPPNATGVPLPVATFPPPGGNEKGGAVAVMVPPNATIVPPPVAVAAPAGTGPAAVVVPTVPGAGQPLAAPVQVTVTAPQAAPVKPADDADTILVARLNAGDQSKELQRELAAMDKDRLTGLLERLKPYGQEQAADALVRAFLARPGVSLGQRRDWSRNVTLQVAGALGRHQDGRCVEVFEKLLASRGEKTREVPWELIGLAKYHTSGGRHREVAEAWLRVERHCIYYHEVANSLVAAARALTRAGDYSAAATVYERVAPKGYGWATGLAVYDQASRLIDIGAYEEAERLLDASVRGDYSAEIGIAIEYLRAKVLSCKGDRAGAAECCERLLRTWYGLPTPLRNEGLEAFVAEAWRLLATVRG